MGSGHTAQADRIEQKIRSGFIRLQAIEASARVATMHAGMIEYYRSAVAFLDAHSEGDVAARRAAELDTWIGSREFFVDLRGLLVRHECASRDVETIDRRYMPALNDRIQKLRAG